MSEFLDDRGCLVEQMYCDYYCREEVYGVYQLAMHQWIVQRSLGSKIEKGWMYMWGMIVAESALEC